MKKSTSRPKTALPSAAGDRRPDTRPERFNRARPARGHQSGPTAEHNPGPDDGYSPDPDAQSFDESNLHNGSGGAFDATEEVRDDEDGEKD